MLGQHLDESLEHARIALSQNLFHTLFQLPNSAGSRRQATFSTMNEVYRLQKLAVVTPLVSAT